ncbi:hypothetical protein QL285_046471 [Trifolium repens]|nr:hypothetical protein QL285_046471 [Trifolium repens]
MCICNSEVESVTRFLLCFIGIFETMKISHPYLEPMPQRDPPRPVELDAIIHEEARAEGQRMATCVSKMLHILQMIRALMASDNIPTDSRPYSAL